MQFETAGFSFASERLVANSSSRDQGARLYILAQFEYSLPREAAWLGDRVEASKEREGGTSLLPKYGQSRLIYGIWYWLGEILVAIWPF